MTKEDIYWMCRKSLRIWPVPGKTNEDISKALGVYMRDRLKISSKFLSEMGELSVKRIASNGPRIKDEITAVFSSIEVRDAVRRAAKELAGDNEAGIRLEVPTRLQPSLKALELSLIHI